MERSIIKILKKKYPIILMFITMIASVSSVSAIDFPMIKEKSIYDAEIVKSSNLTYAVVNLNEKVNFTATTSNIDKIDWNFGDSAKIIKTKTKNQVSSVTHTFKKVGTYKVKVDIKGTSGNINLENTEEFITVKVVKKPDLVLTKLSYDTRGKDTIGIYATVINKGSVSSKACYMKMWYENKKFNKYTKSAKIPALKSGKSTSILIKFQIPYKYRNYVKYINVDSSNKITESIKSNNQKTFK